MAFGSYACQKIKMRNEDSNKKMNYRQIFDYSLFGTLYTVFIDLFIFQS